MRHPRLKFWVPFQDSSLDVLGLNNLVLGSGTAVYGPGALGRAVEYNGTNRHEKTSGVSLDLDGDICLSMWLNCSSWIGGFQALFAINDTYYPGHTNSTLYMQIDANGITFGWDRSGSISRRSSVQSMFVDGTWNHLAFVASAASSATGSTIIYLNGVAQTTYSSRLLQGTMPPLLGTTVMTGAYRYSGTLYSGIGKMCDLRIYNAWTPASDVRRIMTGLQPISV